MQETGWIKLHRSILKWEWWDDHNTTRLFIYLLAKSNHKKTRYMGYEIPVGASVCGYPKMALDTGLTIRNLRTSLKRLKMTGEVTVKVTPKFSIISIVKWEAYQADDRLADRQVTGKRQASDRQVTTSKEVKNVRSKEYNNTLTGMLTEAVEIWNSELSGKLPAVKSLSDKRKKKLTKLLKNINVEEEGVENFRLYCRKIAASSFLTGADGRWKANFDWVLEEANMLKIVEGNYDNQQ